MTQIYIKHNIHKHRTQNFRRISQGMDRPGVRQVTEDSGEQGRMEESGCEIISGAPTTLTVKG